MMTKHNWTGEPQDSDSKSDLKALRVIAERATLSGWILQEQKIDPNIRRTTSYLGDDVRGVVEAVADDGTLGAMPLTGEDVVFITLFSPRKVLELLDRIETEEIALDILEEVLDYHSDVVTTHYEKCYLWHVSCLAVKLKRLLKGAG